MAIVKSSLETESCDISLFNIWKWWYESLRENQSNLRTHLSQYGTSYNSN
jgi:hypothetical protein